MKNLKYYLILALKGCGMGAANIIPGVSGGTIALITGIFEEIIDSIKSFDIKAAKLLLGGKFKEFAKHVNLWFLLAVFGGAIISVFSLAVLLDFLFLHYNLQVYAFFFGLILASVYFVGKTIEKWNLSVIIAFAVGTAVAVIISMLRPATENDGFIYLVICGVVAICSMILPGLSGSFILILLGNYYLVMVKAVKEIDVSIIFPVGLGAVGGLIAFSHLLSWVYKKFRDQTISILTGFILGSLAILWPWKNEIVNEELSALKGEKVIESYERFIPTSINMEVVSIIALIIIGIVFIGIIEKWASKYSA